MLKFVTPIAALAIAVAPVATAEEAETITIQFEYDSKLLADETSAESVLTSLESQAKEACTYTTQFASAKLIDRSCVKSSIAAAATKIVAEREAEGLETATIFEQQATVQVASLN